MSNIWILTEEKPKISVTEQILEIYRADFGADFTIERNLVISPIIHAGTFTFRYLVTGFQIDNIENVYIEIVSGESSFFDYMFYVQDSRPIENCENNLLFVVEETKTNDQESRNQVYQRLLKFAYIDAYYPDVPRYMLYNNEFQLCAEREPTDTNRFGINLLLTNGVGIVGRQLNPWFRAFESIDDLIEFKNGMQRPHRGNVPILITQINDNIITISGKLDKTNHIGEIVYDPNMGALSYIAYTLRRFDWLGEIVIVDHHINQNSVNNERQNKFLSMCHMLNITLEGITMPTNYTLPDTYWHYDRTSEKIASILFHIACECIGLTEVYQNHAGCERGYFIAPNNVLIALPKTGFNIPDVIMRDDLNRVVYLMEGKTLSKLNDGLRALDRFNDVETNYINRYYPCYTVRRYLTIFGGTRDSLPNDRVFLYLNNNGLIVLNDNAEPDLSERIRRYFNI